MRHTKKYMSARDILTLPHSNQEELYSELNRLGWFWDAKKQKWERDDRLPADASKLIKIRVWADEKKTEQITALIVEAIEKECDLRLLEKSSPYLCRPPKQSESRIYLSFEESA